MSVDCIQSLSSPPLKRSRENVILPSGICSFKCGELLVTPSGDMWTFNCTVCSLSTSDIGVFICHIKLQHLNCQPITQELDKYEPTSVQPEIVHNVPPSPLPEPIAIIPNRNLFSNVEDVTSDVPKQLVMECSITKQEPLINDEEPLPSILVDSGNAYTKFSKLVRTESLTNDTQLEPNVSNKNFLITAKRLSEISKENFSKTSKEEEKEGQVTQKDKNEIVHIFYNNDVNEDEDYTDYDDNNDESLTISVYDSLSDSDSYDNSLYLESNNSNSTPLPRGSQFKTRTRLPSSNACHLCEANFSSIHLLHNHMRKLHGNNDHKKTIMHKCRHCTKIFRSLNGLKNHLQTHNDNNFTQCPVCLSKYQKYYFVSHVLTHESATCFPCQVCGRIHETNKERMHHWETHAKDLPYCCNICYRRFRKSQYLVHHLKIHCQYKCCYCANNFYAAQTQKPPYVCWNCEQETDIRKKS